MNSNVARTKVLMTEGETTVHMAWIQMPLDDNDIGCSTPI